MNRRMLLKSAMGFAMTSAARSAPIQVPSPVAISVIDAHIHLFDPTRKGGVPWPNPSDTPLYKPALPPRYARLAEPHGVVGAIAVEASPMLLDNFWLEDVVGQYPIMLGFVGNLLPDSQDFAPTLDRLHRSALFLGIRYGNLWNRDLGKAIEKAEFVSGLKLLSQAGLVLETANPDSALIAAVLRVSDRVPDLRIVLDHLPHVEIPSEASLREEYWATLRELAMRSTAFVKGSEILRRVKGQVTLDVATYKAQLDQLWDLFGEDRIFFGSDWPNSDSLANYDETFGVAQRYIDTRSPTAQEKYFWNNSLIVYRWKARTPAQKTLLYAERPS